MDAGLKRAQLESRTQHGVGPGQPWKPQLAFLLIAACCMQLGIEDLDEMFLLQSVVEVS